MASHTSRVPGSKPSFATIAAMAPPIHKGSPALGRENENPSKNSSSSSERKSIPQFKGGSSALQLQRELQNSMSRLTVKESIPASRNLNEEAKTNISRAGLRIDDEQTHVSSSSTKAASLDGKSTTSGNTFALDEKESLRPDDSASVKAAEDEDLGSGPASGAQNSRIGSEAGSRAFRDQFCEISESIGPGSHRLHPPGRTIIPGIEEEGQQVSDPPLAATLPAPIIMSRPEVNPANGALVDYGYRKPDEKLFEALQSAKDRMFLLRLEQDVILFVKDSKKPAILDLPPCNSFCRLLAHKLADYYALTHYVDNAVSSVRLYRTPYCRIPTPLNELSKAQAPAPAGEVPTVQPAIKIMRRTGRGKDGQKTESGATTATNSMPPSKAGSETGDESQQGTGVVSPTDSNAAKDKSNMTREEREANYRARREQLFGPESENADSNDTSNDVSRTNSRNEKKKKKHNKNNDDGFEARSQFNAYYPTVHYPMATYDQATNGVMAYCSPYTLQSGNTGGVMLQQGYQQGYPPMPNTQGFPSAANQAPMISCFNGPIPPSTYNQQTPTQYYSAIHQGSGMNHPSPGLSSPPTSAGAQMSRPPSQMTDQQWPQNGYSYPYLQPREQQQFFAPPPMQNPNTRFGVTSVPYQYGQLPYQPGLQGAKAQHPLPGSYSRQTFNPQTRAFVPNSGSNPPQTVSYGGAPSPMRNTSTPSSNGAQCHSYGPQAPSYLQMATTPFPGGYNIGQESKVNGTRKSSSEQSASQSPAQSSLSKWGTPANLPAKPPPPEIPNIPEAHSLPMNNQFNVNVQPMSGGQPMPSFHNGVYSIPGVVPQ